MMHKRRTAMDVFFLTLKQMLMMFSLILVGVWLRKKCLLPDNAHITMSKLETFVFVPALSLFNQINKCTVENFTANSALILYGLVLTLCALALSFPLSRLFIRNASRSPALAYQRSIYQYALTFSNFGFMGNFIILGVFGNDVFFQYSLFNFFLSLICNSWGLYMLIPKEQNVSLWKNLKKGLTAPPFLAMIFGMALGLLDLKAYVPDFLMTAFENAGKCQGPVAMVLAGFVIGGYNLKEMFTNKKVYAASALRLLVIPAVIVLLLKLIGTPDSVLVLALIAFCTPLGLNTIVYPAAYGGDTKTGAAMTMVSHLLSVITIPLMYLLFIEMM
ncbi:MAG: AEC family transporter [Clostridiales bacterium]|nr:AEC family transporter [Clostridiales bacterium]